MKMLTASLILVIAAVAAKAQNVTLTITGIQSNKGTMIVSVFKDEQSFEDHKASAKFKFSKAAVANGTLKVSLTLAPGTYGIAMLDDENANGKMDKNMVGYPKEGFGFSNFYLSGLKQPKLKEFSFEVKNAPVKLESKLRYM